MCDTLNLITGEYVQRIGETVFSGNEGWGVSDSSTENTIRFSCNPLTKRKNGVVNINCDKFIIENVYSEDREGFLGSSTSTQIYLRISKSKLSSLDNSGLNTWLQSNPTTVQYELATPIVKTVDLTGGLSSYRGTTHYFYSGGEGSLIPTLSINVPTHLSAFISKQRSIIEEQARTIAEQEEAQNLLIETQLSWYEATTAISPLSLDENETQVPDYMQQLYNLAYERGIRTRKN